MANSPRGKGGNGGPSATVPASAPPEQIANVPAPYPLVDMNSIFLQSLMETQKLVAELGAKTDRLISDVSKQNEKVGRIKTQISFVQGASWIIGGLLTAALALGITVYNKTASPSIAQTNTAPAGQPTTAPSSVR